nr:MAG TPA: hypothetical protein [Caudoviricetes sp.]
MYKRDSTVFLRCYSSTILSNSQYDMSYYTIVCQLKSTNVFITI